MKSRKLNIFISIVIAVFVFSFTSCSKWTDQENINYFELPDDAYYEALREYKASDHQVSFGWFGNWTGTGSSLVNSLIGIPDSVDLISIWGPWESSTITDAKKKDLEFVQKVKGFKVMGCSFAMNVGDRFTPEGEDKNEYWGWDDNDVEKQEAAIRKYARAFADSVNQSGLDGFDIDHEPNYGGAGNLASHRDRMHIFISELGKYFGPKSGTDKLLVIDGEPQSLAPESGEYLNYFIVQAYKSPGDHDLNSRLTKTIKNYEGYLTPEEVTKKYIVTENFESVYDALAGGYNFVDSNGNTMKSLEGMARWQPFNGFTKGGVGTYHMEAEYPTTPEYKWLRNAIQIMNPSLNLLIK
ncbi:glycoside hydrolase family 18 [Bacteroides sp.]|uniref:glycoside hydrolase family 18 n=1 Tax=Bacteroides sp. TaxID=29523 RepID=UPI00258CB27B|nr:glycoside hydrolase family 18 [Bacteroides sp.]